MTKATMINELGIVSDKLIKRAMRRDVEKIYKLYLNDKEHKEFYKSLLVR